MAKRSSFERRERDAYFTPYDGVLPLIPHLESGQSFYEPFAGDGAIVRHLDGIMECSGMSDIEPMADGIEKKNAFDVYLDYSTDIVISNCPWQRTILHKTINHFRVQKPLWLLFDMGWMNTVQAAEYLQYCDKIVSVGRVSWAGNGKSGMEDCGWFRFQGHKCETVFYGRNVKTDKCTATPDMFGE